MKLLFRQTLSYAIDYLIFGFFVSLFTFCANVFYLDPATLDKAIYMLICALVVVIFLTTYVPCKNNGQTIGQKICKIKVVNKSEKPRTYFQCFIRECVVKMSCAPLYVVFTTIYVIVQSIIKRELIEEMPLDALTKTRVVDLTIEIGRASCRERV